MILIYFHPYNHIIIVSEAPFHYASRELSRDLCTFPFVELEKDVVDEYIIPNKVGDITAAEQTMAGGNDTAGEFIKVVVE